jgi:hypothetical protein
MRGVALKTYIGAIFMLGDSLNVLEGSKQLVPITFQGHDKTNRMLTNSVIHDALNLEPITLGLRFQHRLEA